MRYDAVLFDYYGTLAEHDGGGVSVQAVLAERGYRLSAELARAYWQDGLDGTEHDDHSQSRDHYVAWQQSRLVGLLDECGVPDDLHDEIIAALRAPDSNGRMNAYSDSREVLRALRAAGLRTAICSNWDWDLHESLVQAELDGLVDLVVSSAWVGARKPHPRIYEHTLEALGVTADRALFVGDTWNCDVAGPLALGMTVVYVRRPHRDPDHTATATHAVEHHRGDDLGIVLEAVGIEVREPPRRA